MIQISESLYLTEDISSVLQDVKNVLEQNGVKRFYKTFMSGRSNLMTCCPFHKDGQEKKPSFGININTGECHCFGCGWQGTFAEMLSNCFGYDDGGIYGNKWLLRNYIAISVENRPALDFDLSRSKNIPQQQYVTEAELALYRYTHPYMYKRKMNDEVIELFDIGYDKDTDCITFPVRDVYGRCEFVAKRSVKTKFFNYPEGVLKPVYGLFELYSSCEVEKQEIIICESMIDAITCWVYGKYAVALNGTGNDLQFKQLRNMPNRKFILATDMDEAGLKARNKIAKALSNKLVTQYVWDLSVAKDINDMSEDYFNSLQETWL